MKMDRKNILIATLALGLVLLAGYTWGLKGNQTKVESQQQVSTDKKPEGQNIVINDTSLKSQLDFFTQPDAMTQESVPNELKRHVFEDYYANQYQGSGFTGCFDQKKTCSLADKTLNLASFDLNGDGQKEYIVSPIKICDCHLRGASGNGDILIIKSANTGFKVIGKLIGNSFLVSKVKTNGYHDILTNFHSSAATGSERLYKFQVVANGDTDNNQYEEAFSKWYDYTRTEEYQKQLNK